MEELLIEEKAKRYDEALERANEMIKAMSNIGGVAKVDDIQHIFPELKESEDERIMKALYKMAKVPRKEIYEAEGITKEQALAWLEKQGKQKETLCDKCKKAQPSHSCQDITALGRCALEKQGEQKLTEFEKAVKQVMEEAIECGDTRSLKADAEMLLSLVHKSAWSEEDEKILSNIIKDLVHPWNEYIPDRIEDEIKWLKNKLKPLRPQKQDVMSEDEFRHIVGYLVQDIVANEHMAETEKQPTKFFVEKYYKKLRHQNTWKPSEEQMKQLGWIAEQNKDNMIGKELMTLYQDLKKLREE